MKKSPLIILLSLVLILAGCGGPSSAKKDPDTPRDATPRVLTPTADGKVTLSCPTAAVDLSNTDCGYIMVSYTGNNPKVKMQLALPDGMTIYTYLLAGNGQQETFPLTGGDGSYLLTIYEQVEGDTYAACLSQNFNVNLSDEFTPFLYPNQYAFFEEDDRTVTLAKELAEGASNDLAVITAVYNYIIENISYDIDKAATAQYGYLPDNDSTLTSGRGICFDYAALMTSMLRSQGIPTRLEVGYVDTGCHAWISAYVPEIGWVNNIIEFDGVDWSMMDPTFAASSPDAAGYVGDGSSYTLKYSY